jgi:hypothetical protein
MYCKIFTNKIKGEIKMKIKKILSVNFALLLALLLPVNVFAAQRTITTAPALAWYDYQGYDPFIGGPISIAPVNLHEGTGQNVQAYLIGLSGTEPIMDQATGIFSDIQSGMGLNSDYLTDAVNAINKNIPIHSNLIISGHSLGGMIAQQISASPAIKANYTVLNVVAFGSPVIDPSSREGVVRRLADTSDIVPYLSVSSASGYRADLSTENGGYFGDPLLAHAMSYLRSDVWGAYDALGLKYGHSYIQYDDSNVKFYAAPSSNNF